MNQVSFSAFAQHAQQSSRRGVNPKARALAGPLTPVAGGPGVCTVKKPRRKPRPVDQLPLPLPEALAPIEVLDGVVYWHGTDAGDMKPGFYDPFGSYVNSMDAPHRIPCGGTLALSLDGRHLAFGGVRR